MFSKWTAVLLSRGFVAALSSARAAQCHVKRYLLKPIDPSPYVVAYGVLVFLAPWLVFMSFNICKLLYAWRNGIPLWSYGASARIRSLRQTDPYAAHLHQRCARWMKITLVMWLVGFALLNAAIYVLHSSGII